MPARVLFSTGSLYLLDTAQSFALAAEAGYDGIEIMCDDRYGTRDPHYLRELSDQYGLPVLVAHTPFSQRLSGWENTNEEVHRVRQTLKLAERLGCEAIVVHVPRKFGWGTLSIGGKTYFFPWFSPFRALKTWIERELLAVQRETPVKIALENMPLIKRGYARVDPTWWNEIETWSKLHNYLTLDTTHWGTKGVDPLVAYRAAQGRVCHVHLSNYDGEEHRLPENGRLDLGALLRALAADGYEGTISLEVSPEGLGYTDRSSLLENMKICLRFCREHLRQTNVT
jgi:sugar phosphate isomerase/epimerase